MSLPRVAVLLDVQLRREGRPGDLLARLAEGRLQLLRVFIHVIMFKATIEIGSSNSGCDVMFTTVTYYWFVFALLVTSGVKIQNLSSTVPITHCACNVQR